MTLSLRLACAALILGFASAPLAAQDRLLPLADVLQIDATVSSEVAPDLAVVTLAVDREGADVAALTKDVNETLAKAFADAKTVAAVVASSGAYSTFPRYDSRNSLNVRNGWQVRAEIIVKSKDFAALGTLVGRLAQTLQIAGSSFEVSPDLRARESAALIDRGARAFQDKATATAKAFGYAGWSIREITVGSAGQSGSPRMMADYRAMSAKASAPLPVEAGLVTLTLTVNGSLQMRK